MGAIVWGKLPLTNFSSTSVKCGDGHGWSVRMSGLSVDGRENAKEGHATGQDVPLAEAAVFFCRAPLCDAPHNKARLC